MNEITNITTDPRLLILKVNSLLDSLNDQQTATLYTLLNQPNSDEQLRIVVNLICHTILANTLSNNKEPSLMFDWKNLAERSYTAYGQVTSFKNFKGDPMPEFDELPETIQEAWIAAVTEAVSYYCKQKE